jgi:hypothetical protein
MFIIKLFLLTKLNTFFSALDVLTRGKPCIANGYTQEKDVPSAFVTKNHANGMRRTGCRENASW